MMVFIGRTLFNFAIDLGGMV